MEEATKIEKIQGFIKSLNLLVKSVRLYGQKHDRVTEQSFVTWRDLRAAIPPSEPLVLGVSAGRLLANGEPLRESTVENSFLKMLMDSGISSLQFFPFATADEFEKVWSNLAFAGRKKNLCDVIQKALASKPNAGIRVNAFRFVTEDAAMVDARTSVHLAVSALGFDPTQMQNMLDDPQKMLQLLAVADSGSGGGSAGSESRGAGASVKGGEPGSDAGTAAGPAGQAPLEESDVSNLLGLLGQLSKTASQPDSPAAAEQLQEQLATLPANSKEALQQALAGLAAQPPPGQQDKAMLLQLAEHLTIRFALDRFQRGDTEVSAVSQLLDKMGHEIAQLRQQLGHPAEEPAETDEEAAPSASTEDLHQQFWAALTPEQQDEVLRSEGVWRVPPFEIHRAVERLVDAGEEKQAGDMLINYASQINNESSYIRREIGAGMQELASLYALSYEEVLDAALAHLETQLGQEEMETLQKSLSETYLHMRQEAAQVFPTRSGEATLFCCTSACGQNCEIPIHRPSADLHHVYHTHLYCATCGVVTEWNSQQPDRRQLAAERRAAQQKTQEADRRAAYQKIEAERRAQTERRTGKDRRRSNRARMKLPIRIRFKAGPEMVSEVSKTLDISRHGVRFVCSRQLELGQEVFVLAPYNESEELPETRARVIRVFPHEDKYSVAVEYIV